MRSGTDPAPPPEENVLFFDLSPMEAEALALAGDRPRPVRVAVDRLQPAESDCESLQRFRHWFAAPAESGDLSWQARLDYVCADTPGCRPECSKCPAFESPGEA